MEFPTDTRPSQHPTPVLANDVMTHSTEYPRMRENVSRQECGIKKHGDIQAYNLHIQHAACCLFNDLHISPTTAKTINL